MQTKEEFRAWLIELKKIASIPTSLPDVTAFYRDNIEDWNQLETWQKEDLMELYQEFLVKVANDSQEFCDVGFTVEELRNLSDTTLSDLAEYITFRIPKDVLHRRLCSTPEDEADLRKCVCVVQKITRQAIERRDTLERIKNLGQ